MAFKRLSRSLAVVPRPPATNRTTFSFTFSLVPWADASIFQSLQLPHRLLFCHMVQQSNLIGIHGVLYQ